MSLQRAMPKLLSGSGITLSDMAQGRSVEYAVPNLMT